MAASRAKAKTVRCWALLIDGVISPDWITGRRRNLEFEKESRERIIRVEVREVERRTRRGKKNG